MAPSIRTFLLINLLLSVTLVTSLAIIGNLFLDHRDIQNHLDSQLTLTAFTIQALLTDYDQARNLSQIRKNIRAIPTSSAKALETEEGMQSKAATLATDNLQFQVWGRYGKLLLGSNNVLSTPLSDGTAGFIDKAIDKKTWRVFTLKGKRNGFTVMVAERYNFRDELEGRITRDSIYIMLITYPFLGLLIWVIVGRGLEIIRRVADEIRHRAPGYLESVDLESVPSEIQPLVDELNKLLLRLREALAREKRFAGDAAHELRTPLAALKTQAQVAVRAPDEAERLAAINKVIAGVDRSAHVVQQLLILNRMGPQAVLEDLTRVNLAQISAEIIAEIVPSALEKNTEIELIAPDEPASMLGQIPALGILVRNLVDNAVRYSPENSRVLVEISVDKEFVTLEVTDNGPGIPVELRSRVFERFFRVLGNKSTGSGLGLGIVHQIADLYKADLTLEKPETGTGLRVCIKFPRGF